MNPEFTLKQAIQFCYPDEPEWGKLPEKVLIELIQDYQNEQSCATSALYELSSRNHIKAVSLAQWLLAETDSDEWLKKSAISIIDQ